MKSKNNKVSQKTNHSFSHEVVAILFLGIGLFITISLVSYLFQDPDNILGPIFGTFLSRGLVALFGYSASLIFPSAMIFIGISMLKNQAIPLWKMFLFCTAYLLICTLLAIHNLPHIIDENFFPTASNSLGNIITFLLYYVFGPHTFGPYFLVCFFLFLIIPFICGIPIRRILSFLYKGITHLYTTYAPVVTTRIRKTPLLTNRTPITKNQLPAKVKSTTSLALPQSNYKPLPSFEPSDDEKQIQLERELAAFRARKNHPVTIVTETDSKHTPPSPLEHEEDENLDDITEMAVIDPSLIQDQNPRGEKRKAVSSEVVKQKKPISAIEYHLPDPDILPDPPETVTIIDRKELEENTKILEKTLLNFNVEGKVMNISPGPVVTRYEIELAPGIKISKIVNLQDDLSLAVGGKKIRIEAPIPGKAAVGIELPNAEMQLVTFKNILTSDVFRKTKSKLPLIIGKSISGIAYVSDIVKMPHLLIAGQTGSGKSVAINSIICSLLMTKRPDELRLILIDPKKVEMSLYEHIPHLLAPVVTESKEAVKALQWGVIEMTRRYRLLAKVYARNIDSFNQKITENTIKEGIIDEQDNKKLPFIVIVVDELADLMMTASRDVEGLIQRIAQLARAVGIHLVVATQRPSVDIITGPIKANLTSRIAFRTIQSTDSRTILGRIGAEKLLGRGDMLFLRNGAPDIERYHGAFISEEDVEKIVTDIRSQNYEMDKIESFDTLVEDSKDGGAFSASSSSTNSDPGMRDEKFEEAARLIVSTGLGSTSLLQRRLKLGYARAGRLMDELHDAGIVGPQEGSKAREVLLTSEVLEDLLSSLQANSR